MIQTFVLGWGAALAMATVQSPSTVPASYFSEHIQPIFDARCISCHSCYESPCQMNLQTYAGVQRGANLMSVYRGDRLDEIAPTRMFEDAPTTAAWREKEFFDVLQGGEKSIFWRLIAVANQRKTYPSLTVRENTVCVQNDREMTALERSHPEFAMPYALPALTVAEELKIKTWLEAGAPGQLEKLSLEKLSAQEKAIVRDWESYLNAKDLKSRLVSRYLFEHLFLAHFAFPGKHSGYLKLVRSSTPCSQAVTPVNARQPNDDPGVKEWHYCFYEDLGATVAKKHIPFEISEKKLNWLKSNFAREKWSAKEFPSFAREVSRNPFVAFKDLPVAARYRFLLEDARYHIMTFIKGPVCNGSIAVNVIREQFFVFFIDPSKDVMILNPEFATESEGLLILPGNLDANLGLVRAFKDFQGITELRNRYRALKARQIETRFPKGLDLSHVWNGNGENPNAMLTVFRHDDNAEVVFGAQGDLPRTIFMLDYSIFERLVYNLVVNFDVFGDVQHQAMTRLYMDMIRMEAENNYLDFLPPQKRLDVKRDWYRGTLTQLKINLLNEDQFPHIPAAMKFDEKGNVHAQLIDWIVFDHLSERIRGQDDLNRKKLRHADRVLSVEEKALREIASISVHEKSYFAKRMPEFSVLALKSGDQVKQVYSLIRNREHENISWMFGEGHRRDPKSDTLTILPGVKGSYPNEIFVVEATELPAFSKRLQKIGLERDYEAFRRQYTLSRRSPEFWTVFDQIQDVHRREDPAEAGLLDLSRYRMETAAPGSL